MGTKQSVCHIAHQPRALVFHCWSFLDGATYMQLRLVCKQWHVWMISHAVPGARFSFTEPLWDMSQVYPGAARSFRRFAADRCCHRAGRGWEHLDGSVRHSASAVHLSRHKWKSLPQCCEIWSSIVSMDATAFDFVDASCSERLQELFCKATTSEWGAEWGWIGYKWPRLVALHLDTLDSFPMRYLAMGEWTAVTRLTFTVGSSVITSEIRAFLALFVSLRELEILGTSDFCCLSESLDALPEGMTALSVYSSSDDLVAMLKVVERLRALTVLLIRFARWPIVPGDWPYQWIAHFAERIRTALPDLHEEAIPLLMRRARAGWLFRKFVGHPFVDDKGVSRLSRPLDYLDGS